VTAQRPLQNRVDPYGQLVAVAARGALMGNRGGRFHRPDQTLGRRRWASRQWISCRCAFQGRHRDVWGASYTELFFLDEPTALAAGHRPCFLCRRADAEAFRRAFAPDAALRAPEIDAVLHRERLTHYAARQRLGDLPDGTMIAWNDRPHAVRDEVLLPWRFSGYDQPEPRRADALASVLTPPSIVAALRRGYRARWAEDLI